MSTKPTSRAPHPHLPSALNDPGHLICASVIPAPTMIDAVLHQLVTLGFIPYPTPLEQLHQHLPAAAMALNEHVTNEVSRAFYTLSNPIVDAYRDLIAHVARHLLEEDFLFQDRPIIRFHFPVPFPDTTKTRDGQPRQLHSDLLGGHPTQMVQGWLALTDCADTAALQCSSREDGVALLEAYRNGLTSNAPPFADSLHHYYATWDSDPAFATALIVSTKPLAMQAGELLLFDPHCIHGATENQERTTRVSLDFRILPIAHEAAALAAASTETGRRFRRDDLFCAKSAWELFR